MSEARTQHQQTQVRDRVQEVGGESEVSQTRERDQT